MPSNILINLLDFELNKFNIENEIWRAFFSPWYLTTWLISGDSDFMKIAQN